MELSVHDNILYGYIVVSDQDQSRSYTIILYTEFLDRPPVEYTDIVFTGVVAHHFESELSNSILFDVEETDLERTYEADQVRWTLCQAQLLDQFSVWVPPVTRLKRLTLGPRARPGRLCPAEKIGWCPPPPLAVIPIGRAAIVERLMRPLGVGEREIAGEPHPGLARAAIVAEIDLL